MLAVPMDKSDIPGFARSDIFLSESEMKACLVILYSPIKLPQAI